MEDKQQARELYAIQQQSGSAMGSFIKDFKFNMNEGDPLKNCALFKDQGCAHIDGMLCDFPNCEMNEKYISEKKSKEFDEYNRSQNKNFSRVTRSNYTKPKKKRK